MTSTLLLSSVPMEQLPTMGRKDLGWLPTVSSSKSNLISGVFCPCALAVKLPVSECSEGDRKKRFSHVTSLHEKGDGCGCAKGLLVKQEKAKPSVGVAPVPIRRR